MRSQDRESIIKVEKIELIYDYLCSDEPQLFHIDGDKQRLASYSTKERALEVLNNIQHWLIQVNDNKQQVIVYEMPEE